MFKRKTHIEEGDYVVLYEGHKSLKLLKIEKDLAYQNRIGNFKYESFIGKPYGTAVECHGKGKGKNGYNKVLVLHNSPYNWTIALSLRTQILFQMDISLVIYHLDLRPGKVVIESGTGSGSLTTSMARAIAPHGHIHSFEFNAERVEKANIDFKDNQIDHLVTCRHRDVCGQGFPFFPEGIDAVFLDLPTPWVTVDDCHRSLRPQGRFCSFSPCIEQVQRTCLRLHELKYEDIITIECLTREFDVYTNRAAVLDLKKLASESSLTGSKVIEDDVIEQVAKCAKTDEADSLSNVPVNLVERPLTYSTDFAQAPIFGSRPTATMRGHTGYLTFARKPCSPMIEEVTETETMTSD